MHMSRLNILGCLAAALLAAACTTATPKEPPAMAGHPARSYLAQRLPTDDEKIATYSVPASHFGVSVTPGAGNVATGLLLGPLGVAMNIATLRAEAAEHAEALKEVMALDVAALLREEAPDLGGAEDAARDARRFELVPAVTTVFADRETYRLSCSIIATLIDNGGASWRLRYTASPEGDYKLPGGTGGAEMKPVLRSCIARAYALYRSHLAGEFAVWRSYELETTDGLLPGTTTLTLPVHEASLPTRVVTNNGFALREMRPGSIIKLTPR
jgi:hypothetical protein